MIFCLHIALHDATHMAHMGLHTGNISRLIRAWRIYTFPASHNLHQLSQVSLVFDAPLLPPPEDSRQGLKVHLRLTYPSLVVDLLFTYPSLMVDFSRPRNAVQNNVNNQSTWTSERSCLHEMHFGHTNQCKQLIKIDLGTLSSARDALWTHNTM